MGFQNGLAHVCKVAYERLPRSVAEWTRVSRRRSQGDDSCKAYDDNFLYSVKQQQKLAMEETSSPQTALTKDRQASRASRLKRGCLSVVVSIREAFSYARATLVGQAKYLTARNEEEAAKAELLASKMQVEAANAAENAKKEILKSA